MSDASEFPCNDLEEKLAASFDDPDVQPDFYAAFLTAEIFLLTDRAASAQGKVAANDADIDVSILSSVMENGTPFIPAFTSLAELQHSIDEEHDYLRMTGRELFEIAAGTAIVVNPAHQYGLHLDADDLRALLDE